MGRGIRSYINGKMALVSRGKSQTTEKTVQEHHLKQQETDSKRVACWRSGGRETNPVARQVLDLECSCRLPCSILTTAPTTDNDEGELIL